MSSLVKTTYLIDVELAMLQYITSLFDLSIHISLSDSFEFVEDFIIDLRLGHIVYSFDVYEESVNSKAMDWIGSFVITYSFLPLRGIDHSYSHDTT